MSVERVNDARFICLPDTAPLLVALLVVALGSLAVRFGLRVFFLALEDGVFLEGRLPDDDRVSLAGFGLLEAA